MTDTRPILCGMNNPLSLAPEHALYPYPPNCTGWRIWLMLNERIGISKSQYLRAFDRRNLVRGPWSKKAARANVPALIEYARGREVVVLGNEPRDAIGLPPLLVHPQKLQGVTWRQIPHPSGRNHFYNVKESRDLVADLLVELYSSVNLKPLSN